MIPVQQHMRNLLPLLDSGKKKLRNTSGSAGGLFSRFLAGPQSPDKVGLVSNRSGGRAIF